MSDDLEAFVAAGHVPLTRVVGGQSIVDDTWVDDRGDGHGPQCAACGWRAEAPMGMAYAIPPCDGPFGLARRLRERAVAAWVRAGRAEADAGEAERRALAILPPDVPDAPPPPSFADHLLAFPGDLARLTDRSPLLLEAAQRIVAATSAVAVWHAHDVDVDWDLAVVLPDDVQPQRWTPVTLWRLIEDLGIGTRVVAIRASTFETDRDRANGVARDIALYGRRLA